MSDWQAGDLALCVRNGFSFRPTEPGPQIPVGSVRTVHRVDAAYDASYLAKGVVFLGFDGNNAFTYDHRGFRKIKPLTDEEREEFTAELNAPVRERVQ